MEVKVNEASCEAVVKWTTLQLNLVELPKQSSTVIVVTDVIGTNGVVVQSVTSGVAGV